MSLRPFVLEVITDRSPPILLMTQFVKGKNIV